MMPSDMVASLYRTHLPSFVRFTFREMQRGDPFRDNWHIDVIADALARTLSGGPRRLVINAPPRSLKSLCASLALPAFALGRDPHRDVLVVAGTKELSVNLRRRQLSLMGSSRVRSLFPHLLPAERGGTIRVPHGGGIAFGHVGQGLPDGGADLTIIDDPISPALALDAKSHLAICAWFDAEVMPRLNANSTGSVIVLTRRLHRDDLTGHLLRTGGWAHLALPAIATSDETWPLSCGPDFRRRKGAVLHPERESQQELRALLLSVGAFNFMAHYQQCPLADARPFRTGYFDNPRPDNWTPEMGMPGGAFLKVPETAYVLHDLFGGADPPRQRGEQFTAEEWEAACILQQRRLIAQAHAD